MKYEIQILRREAPSDEGVWETFFYETDDAGATVAMALDGINSAIESGRPVEWECSCCQKKCGACAMVINGTPRLACDAILSSLDQPVRLSPLRKFPLIKDLIVDRSILMENLRIMKQWLSEEKSVTEKSREIAYEASGCLQCGICLELCPNFYPGGKFFGMAAGMPASRIIALTSKDEKEFKKNYKKHVYSGCGKSLACRDHCPAELNIDRLLARSNAAAVFKREFSL